MRVKSAEFVVSAATKNQWPRDGLPAIAFAGRSNVGKSSLINRALNRKALVRVSRTPGRTQLLNFFLVDEKYYFVDLPGYGYAKAPISVRKQWGPMIRQFVEEATFLKAVVQLLDIRHEPTRDDLAVLDWLESIEKPTIVAVTKADKLSANGAAKSLRRIREATELPHDAFTVCSAVDGRGIGELWGRIEAALEG